MQNSFVHFVGTGDAFSSGARLNTCIYAQIKGVTFLIDCGSTSLLGLKKNQLSTADPDALIITHFHGDHFGGMASFLLDAAIYSARTKPLFIYGPYGIEQKVKELCNLLYPGTKSVFTKFPITYAEFKSGKEIDFLKSGKLEAFSVAHNKETLPHGIKVNIHGKSIGFTGDTGMTDNLNKIADKTDLFLCECNFYRTHLKNHLNYIELSKHFKGFRTRKMILTHLGDEMLDLKHTEPVLLAYDGFKTDF